MGTTVNTLVFILSLSNFSRLLMGTLKVVLVFQN